VSTFVPLLDKDQAGRLPARAREVVEYRKSGLSLNTFRAVRWIALTASGTPTACGISASRAP
jgi:hypothetical protein